MGFKKDDYIVLTECDFKLDRQFSIGYVYKQRRESLSLESYLDNLGSKINGYLTCSYDNKGRIKWRYATPEEILAYDEHNKPCSILDIENESIKAKTNRQGEEEEILETEEFLKSLHVG